MYREALDTPDHRGSGSDGAETLTPTNDARLGAFVTVPDAHVLFHGEFRRAGSDLILSDVDHKFVVPDYFATDRRLALLSPEGAGLQGNVVDLLAGPAHRGQYAQAGAAPGQQPIGRIETASGGVTVQHANGVVVQANVGDPVFQGDVVQTAGGSSVGISFVDGSAFNLSANARMVLNEFVYDPGSTNNSALLSIVEGTMSFVAAKVAKSGNMQIQTPAATLGIRGTSGGMIATADGEARYFLTEDPNGHIGEIVMTDPNDPTHILGTISYTGQVTVFTPNGPQQFTIQQMPATPADQQIIAGIAAAVVSVYNLGVQSPYYQGNQNNQNNQDNPNSTPNSHPDSHGSTPANPLTNTASNQTVLSSSAGGNGPGSGEGGAPSS